MSSVQQPQQNKDLEESRKHVLKRKERQKEIYKWILDFLAQNGRFPIGREIGKQFHFSRERARVIMDNLQDDGYILKGKKFKTQEYLLKINPIFIDYGLRKGRRYVSFKKIT